ncbi:amino acid ABC transporter membrane protein 2, PAAT family [Natronoarchaeum philippinense]|uniref:Amino acid ABC transporter membrane protein 2, PAAT family n=1 Tax=Natronoarchaeum philippinense TaxID=558529 RepID=A0A285N9T6_NATPI|nr:amino acid ABC transporter permease [Natronoarchaeum philippinense]SNZ06058.1 amino acid ABC transporter membrane protein 2, PAAT family [Natronoarchaeum philippinense]
MTATEESSTAPEEARGSTVGELPGRRRLIVGGVGVAFWAWLLTRWAYHNSWVDRLFTAIGLPDLIRSEVPVRLREPWIPAGPFETAGAAVGEFAASLGPASFLIEWLAWLLNVAGFATTMAPQLAAGAFITAYLTILSMLFGLVIAVPLSVARIYGGFILRSLSLVYTELIRGTPLLAQLFLLYFGLGLANDISEIGIVGNGAVPRAAIFVAIIGFTINSSAYQSEYIRSALQSVDDGQMTAARSVGLSKLQSIRHVILPQGLRFAIPGWTNEFVYLIKYSSLAAFITVPELFRRAQDIGSDTFRFTDAYVIVAVFYLALVLTTALAMNKVESVVAVPGVGQSTDRE